MRKIILVIIAAFLLAGCVAEVTPGYGYSRGYRYNDGFHHRYYGGGYHHNRW